MDEAEKDDKAPEAKIDDHCKCHLDGDTEKESCSHKEKLIELK